MTLERLLAELGEAANNSTRSVENVLAHLLSSLGQSVGIYLNSGDSAPQQFLQKALGLLAEIRPEVLRLLGATLLGTPLTLNFWPVTKHFALLATLDWCPEGDENGPDPASGAVTRLHLLPRTEVAREFLVVRSKTVGGSVHGVIVSVLVAGEWVTAFQLPQDRLTFLEVRNYAIVTSASVGH